MPWRVGLAPLITVLLHAQSFEVASIRPSGPGSVRGSDSTAQRYTFGQATLVDLLVQAYGIEPFQISGRFPLDRRFDVAATLPADAAKEQTPAMLQRLLAERFHLRFHRESKEFTAYVLGVAKPGTKLKLSSEGGEPIPAGWLQEGYPKLSPEQPTVLANNTFQGSHVLVRMRGQRQPVARLARMIRLTTDGPVVNQTGLDGEYDFNLEYMVERSGQSAPAAAELSAIPDLADALREQLGLELKRVKLPFDVYVIDSVDDMPTEN